MNIKAKEDLKRELEVCKVVLDNSRDMLYDFQNNYFNWTYTQQDIINSMKKSGLSVGVFEDILNFCEYRNSFLVRKCKKMFDYVQIIERIQKVVDNIDNIEEMQMIDNQLRMMFSSLSMGFPFDINSNLDEVN